MLHEQFILRSCNDGAQCCSSQMTPLDPFRPIRLPTASLRYLAGLLTVIRHCMKRGLFMKFNVSHKDVKNVQRRNFSHPVSKH